MQQCPCFKANRRKMKAEYFQFTEKENHIEPTDYLFVIGNSKVL